ncbi:heterokaryon incompatibility protein 6, or allele [Acrodontium crateriforme]|uniref:Heterokaryon incompatibility protein 6, or allele n=1 Tax=Acrodontium crateriforme TaxID=150365 RepID=A0AAQ3M436_9PEZI|nr:heterokaryon incompatibility protein 6, or allele [Acrodontium crateriforme]
MLIKRARAGREARKVLNALAWLCAEPNTKKRHTNEFTPETKPLNVADHSSQNQKVAREEKARLDAIHEAEARKRAKANNANYYDKDLATDDDIRLLLIEPGDDGPISGSLQYAKLTDAPDFDSVSYCWGEQKNLQTITINSKEGFLVSNHLHAALCRLRRKDRPRLVWVDVICVNQANIPERNRSVELMWQIYTKAHRVIIWIGEIDAGRPTCKRLFPGLEDESSSLTLCAKPGLAQHEHGNLSAGLSDILRDMELSSARSSGEVWWKRLWVIQEFSCARNLPTVYLGPHAISWKFFSDLMHTDVHDRLQLFHRLRKEDDQNLFDLLQMAKIFHCSDPRDRVYALLGLANDGHTPIVPDYSKPVSRVYEEATLHLIREEGNVDVLIDEEMNRGWDGAPTWVPNFRSLLPRSLVQTEDGYNAGDGPPDVDLLDRITHQIPASFCERERVLRMKALHFDTIMKRTTEESLPAPDWARRPINASHSRKPALSSPLQTFTMILEELAIDAKIPGKHGLDRLSCIGYLMLDYIFTSTRSVVHEFDRVAGSDACKTHLNNLALDIRSIAARFNMPYTDAMEADARMCALWESVFLWTRHTRTYTPGDELMMRLLNSKEMFQVPSKTYKRDFFSTVSGFIGMGPETMKIGDEIIVPFGASRPFVVRRNDDHYVLVGEVVVPGIMSGQLMNLHREGSLQAQDFFFR